MMETTIAYIQQNLYTVISLGTIFTLLSALAIYKVSQKPTTTFLEHIQEDDILDDISEDDVLVDTKDTIITRDIFDKISEAKDSKGHVDKEVLQKLLGDDVVVKSYVEKTIIKNDTKDNIRETVVKSVPLKKSLDDKIQEDDIKDSATNNHSTVSIFVVDIGVNKLEVVKIVYEITGFALKEAHEIAESKGVIPFKVSLKQADRILKSLKDAGAIVAMK